MVSIDGIGGVFLSANDPKALSAWYAKHLGFEFTEYEPGKTFGLEFFHRADGDPNRRVSTVFSINRAKVPLPAERHEVVVNYRVLDLAGFLVQLKQAGVEIEKTEDCDYGKFAWIRDPEGYRIELYQPLN